MNNEERSFYTVEEIALLLKVNPESVRRWVRDGKLRAIRLSGKFIRVEKSALDEFLKKQEIK